MMCIFFYLLLVCYPPMWINIFWLWAIPPCRPFRNLNLEILFLISQILNFLKVLVYHRCFGTLLERQPCGDFQGYLLHACYTCCFSLWCHFLSVICRVASISYAELNGRRQLPYRFWPENFLWPLFHSEMDFLILFLSFPSLNTEYHLGQLKAKIAKLRTQLLEPPKVSKYVGDFWFYDAIVVLETLRMLTIVLLCFAQSKGKCISVFCQTLFMWRCIFFNCAIFSETRVLVEQETVLKLQNMAMDVWHS